MNLVFLHGGPAVGKLTVARELAALTGFRLFHNHLTVDLVSSLFPFGSEPFILLREQIWLAAFAEAARNNVSLIFTFNPERTVRESFVQDAIKAVAGAGGKVVFVELTCDESELERRLENEMSVDTTDRTPAASAQLISEHLQNQKGAGQARLPDLRDS